MNDDPILVIAATPRGWAGALRSHIADFGGAVLTATVLTPEDAIEEPCDIVIVDDVTSFLTPAFVTTLNTHNRQVVGVFEPKDQTGQDRLLGAGVDATITGDADPEQLIALLRSLRSARPELVHTFSAPTDNKTSGVSVGVCGPSGGVGVTEVAIELAASCASQGTASTLIDADELAPSVAQRLGLPLYPNIHTAAYTARDGEDVGSHAQALWTSAPIDVIVGMANGDDWDTIRSNDLPDVVNGVKKTGRTVLVDLGHCPPPASGTIGRRFGHARELSNHCDQIFVVLTPTPVSVARTIDMVSTTLLDHSDVEFVLNRVGRDRYIIAEVRDQLRRTVGEHPLHIVPEEPRVAHAAWQGHRVPNGTFRKAVAAFTGDDS